MSWHDIGTTGTLDDVVNAIREAQQDGRIRGEIFTVHVNIDNGFVRVDVYFDAGDDVDSMVDQQHVTLEVP